MRQYLSSCVPAITQRTWQPSIFLATSTSFSRCSSSRFEVLMSITTCLTSAIADCSVA